MASAGLSPPRPRVSFRSRFHGPHTFAVLGTVYCVTAVLLLAILVPIFVDRRASQRADHRSRASERALALITFLDRQTSNMLGARELLRGFVSSASPLHAPNYTSMNATQRVAVALSSASATGAMSPESYVRISRIVNNSFAGYRNTIVYAGLVTAFSEGGVRIQVGTDILALYPAEFEYCVRNARGFLGLPRRALVINRPNDIVMVFRSPVFTNIRKIVAGDPNRINPATGKHVNWEILWGAITVVMDMNEFPVAMHRQVLPNETEFAWMFESRAKFQQGVAHEHLILYNTTSRDRFNQVEAVVDCSSRDLFAPLCVSVIPAHGDWNGSTLAAVVGYAVLIALGGPAILVLGGYAVVRAAVGPKPDPLKYAPIRAPLHAVCVDLPDANRMWGEVPFIMHDVTMTFGEHIDALAAEHHVYITMRLGCMAVAVSASREQSVAFARAFAEWALGFAWPPHVEVHCPRGTLDFVVLLHTLDNVTVRIDREQGQCEVTGDDMKALLLLRVAAVEQHVMCTGEFLGLPSLHNRRKERHELDASGNINTKDGNSTDDGSRLTPSRLTQLVGTVGELGVVSLPMTFAATGERYMLRGYLLPSAATHGRDINDVLDSFPDRVWSEWISARAFDAAQGQFADPELIPNPLLNVAANSIAGLGRSGGNSQGATRSRTGQMQQNSDRQKVTGAHLNNDSADAFLPGSVADPTDQRRLLDAVIQVVGRSEGGTVGSYMASAPTMLTSHTQALLQERHGPLLAALSMATYYLAAYRIVFAPLEPEVRQAMVARVCAAVGVASEDYSFALAVRCTQLSMRYICPNNQPSSHHHTHTAL